MRRIYTLLILSIPFFLSAQFEQVTVGPSYSLTTWYDLETGTSVSEPYNSWDIAFSTQGFQDAGIFVNEALPLDMAGTLPEVELYITNASDFSEVMTFDTAQWTRLYNQEVNWQWGAFNEVADPMNPLDFGWGQYNPQTMTVEGNKIYVVHLRNGEKKKLKINSLAFDYNFVYADLDGSNEISAMVSKIGNQGNLVYYSLENDVQIDKEPKGWDLQFCRYGTLADNGMGVYLENYQVTGVLAGLNVKIAEADGVDPETADSTDYTNQYSAELDIIGHDWKNFDLGSFQWVMDTDRVYFVKTADAAVCKVTFIDFEGSATGISTLKKDCSNVTSSNTEIENGVTSFNVFPNPSNGQFDIVLELDKSTNGVVEIYNMTGQNVYRQELTINKGFTSRSISLPLPNGMYQLAVRMDKSIITRPIVIAK